MDWSYITEYINYCKEKNNNNNNNNSNIAGGGRIDDDDDPLIKNFDYKKFIRYLKNKYRNKYGKIMVSVTTAKCLDCKEPGCYQKSLVTHRGNLSKNNCHGHQKEFHLCVYRWIMYVISIYFFSVFFIFLYLFYIKFTKH